MNRLFFATLCYLILCSCNHYKRESLTMQLDNPLMKYRKGHYRKVIEDLMEDPNKINTIEIKYILGSSYLELKDYQKAFEVFYDINGFKLAEDPKFSYIFPFYIRKYIQILKEIANPDILNTQEKKDILRLITLVKKDSPIRKYLDKELFHVLWIQKDFFEILVLDKNLSPVGQAWVEIAKHALNKPYAIEPILQSYKSLLKTPAYSNILLEVQPYSIKKSKNAKILAQMSLYVPNQRNRALEFAKQYHKLTDDKEFLVQIQANILALNTQATKGAKLLYAYIKNNPDASLLFYTNTYNQLVKRKLFPQVNEIVLLAEKQYQQKFNKIVPNSIEFSDNPNYVYSWYKKHYKNLSKALHGQAIRALIRYDMKKAGQAVDLGIKENLNNPSYILLRGLIKEYFGKTEEAYRSYLRLILQDAFGYTGIVAREKEKLLRSKYRNIFDKTIANLVQSMKNFQLKDRLIISKVLLLDQETKKLVNMNQLKKDQKAFNKIAYKDLNKVKSIKILEQYNQNLSNLAPETLDYIENVVSEKIKQEKDYHDIARYYYKYRDIFINSDSEGYLTFRLYFYIRDLFGYEYVPNYPKEIVDLVFPRPEFKLIKKLSKNNEDLTYWMLSSFLAESHFRKRVYSHVGAVGFAQVMPYTAADIKRWMKKPYLSNNDFYDNLEMGVYYHLKMYKMMSNNIILSLAAYNAGPGAVRRWKKEYKHIKDDYLFTEAILYSETRNYVKRIIYNRGMYRLLNDHREILFD